MPALYRAVGKGSFNPEPTATARADNGFTTGRRLGKTGLTSGPPSAVGSGLNDDANCAVLNRVRYSRSAGAT